MKTLLAIAATVALLFGTMSAPVYAKGTGGKDCNCKRGVKDQPGSK